LKQFNIDTKWDFTNKGYEILPTPDHSLRLPYAIRGGGLLLDPETLKPIYLINAVEQLKDYFVNGLIYEYSDIFGDIPHIQDIWLNQATQKKQYASYRKFERLKKFEADILPFIQGQTNKQIERLCFNYFVNNASEEEAYILLENHLNQSGIIADDDLQGKRLLQRISSHYKRFRKQKSNLLLNPKPEKSEQLDLLREVWITDIVQGICRKRGITHKASIKRLNKFLLNLYDWTKYIRELPEERRIMINYKYNYFYYYTKIKKLIPLPYVLLRNWSNGHYDKVLNILIEQKVIELKQKYYNPHDLKLFNSDIKGLCNYYKVNF